MLKGAQLVAVVEPARAPAISSLPATGSVATTGRVAGACAGADEGAYRTPPFPLDMLPHDTFNHQSQDEMGLQIELDAAVDLEPHELKMNLQMEMEMDAAVMPATDELG